MICIFTIKNDLHALVIQKHLRTRGVDCRVVEVDQLWKNKLHIEFDPNIQCITCRDGEDITIQEIKLIWWRRSSRGQNYVGIEIEEEPRIYMNQEFEAALLGSIFSGFSGVWISSPEQTYRASNKILQSSIAMRVGLSIPKTLVSQNSERIKQFVQDSPFEIIVKPLTGSTRVPIFTHKLDKTCLPDDSSLSICTTLYQQFIPGNIHYRVNVFGENVYAFKILASDVDWRQDLTVPVSHCTIDTDLILSMQSLLERLNIKMGVFDFKVSSVDSKTYFFEVNPQGNFLFLEGLTGFPIAEKFADFLLNELEHRTSTNMGFGVMAAGRC